MNPYSTSIAECRPMQANVLPVPAAAEEKGCTRQTIYNALDRGELTETRIGNTRLVLLDAQWKVWTPKDTGRRMSSS